MLMPIQWAKEFADFPFYPAGSAAEAAAKAAGKPCLTLRDVTESLTMSGSKVETWESEADEIQNVIVGEVKELTRHPDSDHMFITQIDVGKPNLIQIVTGAQNLKVGDWVPVAMHKSLLPGGKKITKGKLRGVESDGMLCGMLELGLTKHDFPQCIEDGIMVFDDEIKNYRGMKLGMPIVEALGLDDTVIDFEITPNRPDCLSIRNLGRECAATFHVPYCAHAPAVKPGHGSIAQKLRVDIENPDLCYRYCGAVVENVRVKPSPLWMRQRLRNCGVRPINNIVDITNYVMLEYGQPMHCFDYKYVNGSHILVRNAKPGESIVTLDGNERKLQPQMLVIADEKGPIAVAGVMGGEYSGTYADTHTIVFESAMFNGPSVRTTARDLGLRTEASGKYEKGLCAANCMPALQRALELVQLLDAGDVVDGIIDNYPCRDESLRTLWAGKRRIPLRPETINRLLGTHLTRGQMVDYLTPLDFRMDGDDILIPPLRGDMERDCDVAEEIARYVGYNKIPATLMHGGCAARFTERQNFDEKMVNALAGFGLYECETFSFYSPKDLDKINLPANDPLRDAVRISNPLGEDTSIMRTTALPSLLGVIATNYAARAADCAVFEHATEYRTNPAAAGVDDKEFNDYAALAAKLAGQGKTPSDLLPIEHQKLVLAAYGPAWDYLAAKGVCERLFADAGIPCETLEVRRNTQGTTYHPGRAAALYYNGVQLAEVGEIHPKVAANYGVKERIVAANIDLDALFAQRAVAVQYNPLPKHPATSRDLALVTDAAVPAADLASAIRRGAGKNLETLALFDIYTGERIGAGKKSLAYTLTFRAADRTLTDTEVDASIEKVLKNLAEIGVTLRS
jgi:phenylalanyl-tRNA synthetase beta chain